MRARERCMIKLAPLNRILMPDSKMRIYLVQWVEDLEVEEGSNPANKTSHRYLRIYLVVPPMEEEVKEAVGRQLQKNCLKISDYYVKSILINQ